MGTGDVVAWFGLPVRRSPAGILQALRLAGYLADPPVTFRHQCLFMETQDGRLAKGGYRLCLRQAGRGAVWQVSGPDWQSEEAFQGDLPLRGLSPDAAEVPPLIREVAAGRLLLPLVRLKVYAWEARLQSPSDGTLALRVERFIAGPPREAWPAGAERQRLLTVRLLDGNPDALLHLVTYLRDRLNLPPASGDLCRAALLALALPEPGAPQPDHLRVRPEDPLALAARKLVGQQTLKMQANVTGTLEDLDPEYLHDLRVATRRLRSALRLFAGVLGGKRGESLRVELGWIGGLLGAVRDLDVFSLNLQAHAQRLGEAGTAAGLMAEEVGRQRDPARQALVAALTSRRYHSLMRRLETLAASPAPRRLRAVQAAPVAHAAPALIRKAQKRVLSLGRGIGPDSAAADLHRLRILCKRLRYACEFFREAFADPAAGTDPLAEYIAAMVRLQDCLGEHQDAVVAMGRIQDLATAMIRRGGLAAERLLDLGALIQIQREIARQRRGRLAKLWARFDRGSVRKRLANLGGEAPQTPLESPRPPLANGGTGESA
ncbi:MAG TPA: CHAD domain-containing protein [Candidatus Methylomirabilis sp.]|nr:CHAD domain-containing protein [Candidatus Methylomirabilis sp.]